MISMYNLAHFYIYENIEGTIDKSIKLLFKSYKKGFSPSLQLLCIALIIKHKHDFRNIVLAREELEKQIKCCKQDKNLIIQMIQNVKFDDLFNIYKDMVFLYNINRKPIEMKNFNKPKKIDEKYQNIKDITNEFYEGFGKDL